MSLPSAANALDAPNGTQTPAVDDRGGSGDAAESPFILENQVGHLLRRAHQRCMSVYLEKLGQTGITPMQFAAMVRLDQMGTLSQNHLGRLTAMDPATIQGVIRRLMERGYIQRTADTEDRRRMVLKLSATGRTAVRGMYETVGEVHADTLAPLDEAERAQFMQFLRRLT